jgi:hypothetical protein
MKYNRKNRTIVSGILVGVASIGAVASFFNVDWQEIGGFLLATLLFFAGIVLLALLTVVGFKLAGKLYRALAGTRQGDGPGDQE